MGEDNFFMYDQDARKEFLKLFSLYVPIGPLSRWRMVLIHDELQTKILRRKFPVSYLWEYLDTISHWERVEQRNMATLCPSHLLKIDQYQPFNWEVRPVEAAVISSPTQKARSRSSIKAGGPVSASSGKKPPGSARSLRRR